LNYPKPLKIGLVLLLLTILFISFGYAEECADCAQTPSMTGMDYQLYPIMHLSPEQMKARVSDYASQPQITAANFPRRPTGAPTSHDNLPLLTYVTNDRDQANCGNCWVWASTAVMEIALRQQNGISDRLSIQYFNSRYNGGTGVNYACCGGWPSSVDNFYSTAGQQFAVGRVVVFELARTLDGSLRDRPYRKRQVPVDRYGPRRRLPSIARTDGCNPSRLWFRLNLQSSGCRSSTGICCQQQ